MATWDPVQLRDELARIAGRALAPGPYLRDAEARFRRAVQMDGLCWYSLDPTTALMTGHWRSGLPERLPELTHNEYVEDDVSKYAELARRRRPVAVLSRATRGNLERSPRFTSIMKPAGLAHELRAVFGAGGQPWGAAYLLRHEGRPDFTDRDVAALAMSASVLARGFRSILVAEQAVAIDGGHADTLPLTIPGVLVLGPDGDVEVVTDEAREALTALGASRSTILPQAVRAVAEVARSKGGSASVHARAADGRLGAPIVTPASARERMHSPTRDRVAIVCDEVPHHGRPAALQVVLDAEDRCTRGGRRTGYPANPRPSPFLNVTTLSLCGPGWTDCAAWSWGFPASNATD